MSAARIWGLDFTFTLSRREAVELGGGRQVSTLSRVARDGIRGCAGMDPRLRR